MRAGGAASAGAAKTRKPRGFSEPCAWAIFSAAPTGGAGLVLVGTRMILRAVLGGMIIARADGHRLETLAGQSVTKYPGLYLLWYRDCSV